MRKLTYTHERSSNMNGKHREFIVLVAKNIHYEVAYRQVFGKKANKTTAKTNGNKLLHRYAKEIQAEKDKYQKAITEARESRVVQEVLASVLSQAEVDSKLSQIINGELEIEKVVMTPKGPDKAKFKPDHSDILRAIDVYNKRFGSYAALKVDIPSVIKIGYGAEEAE